jgi:hypothetical protein
LKYRPHSVPSSIPASFPQCSGTAPTARKSRPTRRPRHRYRPLPQDGTTFRWSGKILSATPENAPLTLRYIERHVKFLLWQKGGSRLIIAGAPDVAAALAEIYSERGERSFDWGFIGTKIFGEPIR